MEPPTCGLSSTLVVSVAANLPGGCPGGVGAMHVFMHIGMHVPTDTKPQHVKTMNVVA